MKRFELVYLLLSPFFPAIHQQVRSELKKASSLNSPTRLNVLDVGGRKSHYTIGLNADVTVSELPRETEIQHRLNLGINEKIIKQLQQRRSNVKSVIYDDMVKTNLPECCFDIVVAVEVLEHVDEDAEFLRNVHRVLKPGGLFLMTTPNGDYITVVSNPDHRRHYRYQQLVELLQAQFSSVDVRYAILSGTYYRWGLKSWSIKKPLTTIKSMVGNLISAWQSSRISVRTQKLGTHHLIAVARK